MFHHRGKRLVVLAVSLLSGACAAQQPHSVPSVERLTRQDMKYQGVQVGPFTVAPAGVKASDPEAYLGKAQETCARVLSKSGLFETVAAGPAAGAAEPAGAAGSTLVVRAQLVMLQVVTSGRQKWLGMLAGRSAMKVQVTLVDAGTGAVLGTHVVEQDGETAGGPWSFGATDRSLPAEVGTRIAEVAALGARR